MRRWPFLIGLLAVGLLAGCRSASPNAVAVDIDRILASRQASPQTPAINLNGVPATPAEVATLPAVAAVSGDAADTAAAARVKRAIERSRTQTYRTLLSRLRAAYLREAEELREKRLDEFEPQRQAIIQKALDQLSAEYLAYANKKGPDVARLAVLVGFPDPDPTSKRTPKPEDGFATSIFTIAKDLRAKIRELDSSFKQGQSASLAAAQKEADTKLNNLLAEITNEIGDVDARAIKGAQDQIALTKKDLKPLIAERPPLRLAGVPERRITLPAGPMVPAPPKFVSRSVLDSPSAERERILVELHVWLGLNRYDLKPNGKARDATQEFETWRQAYNPAASTQP